MSSKISSFEEKVKLPPTDTISRCYQPQGNRNRIIRILTVAVYVLCVSLAAIMLSLYYIFIWDPTIRPFVTKGNNCEKIVIPEKIAIRLLNTSEVTAEQFYRHILEQYRILNQLQQQRQEFLKKQHLQLQQLAAGNKFQEIFATATIIQANPNDPIKRPVTPTNGTFLFDPRHTLQLNAISNNNNNNNNMNSNNNDNSNVNILNNNNFNYNNYNANDNNNINNNNNNNNNDSNNDNNNNNNYNNNNDGGIKNSNNLGNLDTPLGRSFVAAQRDLSLIKPQLPILETEQINVAAIPAIGITSPSPQIVKRKSHRKQHFNNHHRHNSRRNHRTGLNTNRNIINNNSNNNFNTTNNNNNNNNNNNSNNNTNIVLPELLPQPNALIANNLLSNSDSNSNINNNDNNMPIAAAPLNAPTSVVVQNDITSMPIPFVLNSKEDIEENPGADMLIERDYRRPVVTFGGRKRISATTSLSAVTNQGLATNPIPIGGYEDHTTYLNPLLNGGFIFEK